MKPFCFLLLLLLTFGDVVAQIDESNPPPLRRAQNTNKRRRASKHPCVVVYSHRQYLDRHSEDQPLECELQAGDIANVTKYKLVKVKGLTTKWARNNKVESGVSTFFAANSIIDDDTSELIVPSGETIQLGRRNSGKRNSGTTSGSTSLDPTDLVWNRNLATVTRRVLVLRIVAADKATTATEAMLADSIFGASGDPLNLKSQFNQCSYGQQLFEPVTSNALVGSDGVYTVTLPTTTVTGAADNPIAWAAVDKAALDLGTALTNIAQNVIVCMPPGTSGGWIAYAYINHWLAVFNDDWCGYPSGNLHELGHNLNLAHSSEGTAEYGDQSGLMGYSYGSDDGPIMCFNGPKTWQLGWFTNYHVDLSTASGLSWTGNVIGFAQRDNSTLTDKMIIRIQGTVTDTYINFNRKIGINSGTQEGGDQVLVTTRPTGTGYGLSNLVAKLSASGIYTIPNFNGSPSTLRITVNSITTSTVPGRAFVTIDQFIPTPIPTGSPTGAPTGAPTQSPTLAPTRVPTQSPTQAPTTALPTQSPTQAPTGSPTQAPTQSPASEPTQAPTESPATTQPPTQPPAEAPTQAPTESPTQAPTESPTEAPTESPTQAPTEAPTEAPTAEPTQAPTEAPTEVPTRAPTSLPTSSPTRAPTPPPTTRAPTPKPTTRAPTPKPTTRPPTSRAPTPPPTTRTPTSKPTTRPPTSRAPTSQPTTRAPTTNPIARARTNLAKPV